MRRMVGFPPVSSTVLGHALACQAVGAHCRAATRDGCAIARARVIDGSGQKTAVAVMPLTVLYPEALYPDQSVEQEVYGPEVRVVMAGLATLAELTDQHCAE